jgi:hypothetical protein
VYRHVRVGSKRDPDPVPGRTEAPDTMYMLTRTDGRRTEAGVSGIRAVDVLAVAAGAASAIAVENLTRKVFPTARTELGAAGLLVAAVVYPAARSGSRVSLASAREVAGVAAATAVVSKARSRGGMTARALIAAGWAAHAVFDARHEAGPGGRLPRWYPALCAGYDLAFAASLLRPAPRAA